MRYTPWCDFTEHVSCSRAFTSKYSRTLRIHNSWFGIIAYPVVAWLAIIGRPLELIVTLDGGERGRKFDLLVNDRVIATVEPAGLAMHRRT